MKKLIAVLFASALIAAGCATREDTGALVGAAAGGAAGSQVGGGSGRTIATVVGAVAGGLLGQEVGRRMDDEDRQELGATLENEETNSTNSWVNPDNDVAYEVTPRRTYTNPAGQPCREFIMEVEIDGRPDEVEGTACRQSDGTWEVQS